MKSVIVSLSILLSLLLLSSSYARENEGPVGSQLSSLKREIAQFSDKKAKSIRIEGLLSCNMGETNTGQSCALKIQENGSGKVYQILNGSAAMHLLSEGKKNVAVEGSLENTETIALSKVSAL